MAVVVHRPILDLTEQRCDLRAGALLQHRLIELAACERLAHAPQRRPLARAESSYERETEASRIS
jgi:hypothetical protein